MRRPIPKLERDTHGYWEHLRKHELVIQRCGRCNAWLWQPRPVCSRCQTPDPVWTRVTGDGVVASWMVMRPPTLPAYAAMVPFVILLVELAEGVRLLGYLVDEDGRVLVTDGTAERVTIGARVALRFHDQAGTVLPCWTLTEPR